jgi:hypothetical protein
MISGFGTPYSRAVNTQRGRANRKSFEVEVANADFYS